MKVIDIKDKNQILDYLQNNIYLHIYSIGDLDDFFWPYTKCTSLEDNNKIKSVILTYDRHGSPVILMLSDDIPSIKCLINETMERTPCSWREKTIPCLVFFFIHIFKLIIILTDYFVKESVLRLAWFIYSLLKILDFFKEKTIILNQTKSYI